MDISVSHLNRRMALQIPAEFPLGLVFVVGVVEVDSALVNTDDLREFYLLEEDHHLLCRLSSRAAEGISLKEGDLIRAGGHIAFDQARARYCLLARDVELLSDYEPSGSPVGELIVVSHQIPDPDLAPAPLPQWVKELAPPEVQEEWAARNIAAASVALVAARESITPDEVEPAAAALAVESWQGFGDGEVNLTYITEEPALAELSDELIDFLSEAIDSNDVVELTPAILAELSPPDPLEPSPVEDPAPAALASDPERAYAAQEASIEEFLSALEAAILADESGSTQQDLDLESKNGQTASDSLSQSPDSLSQTAADSVTDSQSDPLQQDQTTPVPPAEPEEVLDLPQEQPPVKSEPGRARQKSKVLPWFILLLAILAAVLLFAIFAVLLIGAGLIPSVAI
jgi:hypothetical protein